MNVQPPVDQIMSWAHIICSAASPSCPELPSDMSLEEQVHQVTDWLIDSHYADEQICIRINPASDSDGRKGCEVYIRLCTISESEETDNVTVFVGYELAENDENLGTANSLQEVEIFKPGLGCLNRLSSVDQFLDSRCQSRFSSAWWRRLFKASASRRTCELRPRVLFVSV